MFLDKKNTHFFRMPFDDRTLTGYLIILFIQIGPSYAICAIIFTVCTIFFGLCWYIMALLDDLSLILDNVDGIYARISDKNYLLLNISAKRQFAEFLGFHLRIIT